MMQWKKALALGLSAILAASALTACGGGSTGSSSAPAAQSASSAASAADSQSSQAPAGTAEAGVYTDPAMVSAEVIKPSFFLTCDSAYDGSEIVWEAIRQYTNIDFQVIPVPLASFKEKIATTLASGDLPDVIGSRDYITVDKYGPQGAFLNLEPYIQDGLMPNYVATIESKPPSMKLATSPDGNRYGAPRIYETPRMDQAILARLDVLEELGLSREPETWDDFYDTIAAVKAAYPNSSPLINRWEVSHLLSGMGYLHNTGYSFYLDMDINDYVFGPGTQNYKDMLSFLAKLYANNLLDKDFATMGDKEYEEKLITDGGMFTYDYQDTGFYEASKHLMDPDWNWGAMLPPKYNGKRQGYPVLEGYYQYTKVISSKTKYPDELVRFFDWTYSEDGARALMFGIEGDTYTRSGDTITMNADIKYAGNPTGTILSHGLNDQNIFSVLTGEGAEFYENVGEFTIAQKAYLRENNAFADPKFTARFYDDTKEKTYSDIKTQVETYVFEASTRVILGQLSVDDWDKEVETMKNTYRVDEGLALIQEAYKETFN